MMDGIVKKIEPPPTAFPYQGLTSVGGRPRSHLPKRSLSLQRGKGGRGHPFDFPGRGSVRCWPSRMSSVSGAQRGSMNGNH